MLLSTTPSRWREFSFALHQVEQNGPPSPRFVAMLISVLLTMCRRETQHYSTSGRAVF